MTLDRIKNTIAVDVLSAGSFAELRDKLKEVLKELSAAEQSDPTPGETGASEAATDEAEAEPNPAVQPRVRPRLPVDLNKYSPGRPKKKFSREALERQWVPTPIDPATWDERVRAEEWSDELMDNMLKQLRE